MEGDVGAVECRYAKATHNFTATKTDELNLTRNEILIITQAIDGGWWEGTNSDGKTGWFPSNYVEELDKSKAEALRVAQQRRVSVANYRVTVLQTVIDTERAYCSELRRLSDVFLRPLVIASFANAPEVHRAAQSVATLFSLHTGLLSALGECVRVGAYKQRIGGIMLRLSPEMKRAYEAYFAAHPPLARLVATRRNEVDACFGATARGDATPTANDLIIGLSAPFGRLEKYLALLKEVERHTDEAHADRGDTQRSLVVLRDMFNGCMDLRKRKERELDIVEGGCVQGMDSNELRRCGEVIYSGACRVLLYTEMERTVDGAYVVLFSNSLLVLSTSVDLSGYRLEERFATQSCASQLLEAAGGSSGKSYLVELADRSSHRRCILVLRSSVECTRWMEALRNSCPMARPAPPSSLPQCPPLPAARLSNSVPGSPQAEPLPPVPVHTAAVPRGSLRQFRSAAPLRLLCNSDDCPADTLNNSAGNALAPSGGSPNVSGLASLVARSSAARPHSKDDSFIRSPKSSRKTTRKQSQKVTPEDLYGKQVDPQTVAEDYRILEVVEAYCIAHLRNRQTLQQPRSSYLNGAPVLHPVALSSAQPIATDGTCSLVSDEAKLDRADAQLADGFSDYERIYFDPLSINRDVRAINQPCVFNRSSDSPDEIFTIKREVATMRNELVMLKAALEEEREWRSQLTQMVDSLSPGVHAASQQRSSLPENGQLNNSAPAPVYSTVAKRADILKAVISTVLSPRLSNLSNSSSAKREGDAMQR